MCLCMCVFLCAEVTLHAVFLYTLLYWPGGRGSYSRLFLSPFRFLLLLTQKSSRAGADMHTNTHTYTADTAFLFVSNLGGFNKSHSSFQAFRPIRDSHCSEGIQTQ